MKDKIDRFREKSEIADKPQSAGRRSLLKGTATALPAILTLQSGAALARSSNMISTSRYKSTDHDGRTLCLDLETVTPVGRRGGDTSFSSRRVNTYDMGPNPSVDVYRIPERDYYVKRRYQSWRAIDEKALCERGGIRRDGIVAYKDSGGMQQIEMPKLRHGGGMLSVTAIASLTADKVVYYDL